MPACQILAVGRHTREHAKELRAVAPLVVTAGAPVLVAPCTLVRNGGKTIAFSSAELLRRAGEPLAIALTFDGKRTIGVASWALARSAALGVIELAEPFPEGESLDVAPLEVAAVCATVETRGAPAALVLIGQGERGFERRIVPVHVDACDGGGMSDETVHLASPQDAADLDAPLDGAPLFAWMPPDAVLGRPSEVIAVALAVPYRAKTFKPRELPAFAELSGLEELGRALPYEGAEQEASNDLRQVAGEIKDDASGPLAGLDLDE